MTLQIINSNAGIPTADPFRTLEFSIQIFLGFASGIILGFGLVGPISMT